MESMFLNTLRQVDVWEKYKIWSYNEQWKKAWWHAVMKEMILAV